MSWSQFEPRGLEPYPFRFPPPLPTIENPLVPLDGGLDFRRDPRSVFIINSDSLVWNVVGQHSTIYQ